MEREETDTIWKSYDQSFREDAHQLLAWGYQDSLTLITPEREETEITGFVAEAIQAKLDSFEIDERFDRYAVKDDNPVPGESRIGKHRRRMDIIIEGSHRPRRKPRPKYIFEAKRLSRQSHGIGKYLGDDGLLRFIQNRYAPDFPEGAMVGYVQTDDVTYWVAALKKHFTAESSGQFRLLSNLSEISIIPDLVDEWSSLHNRLSGTNIAIYHIFLNCLGPRE